LATAAAHISVAGYAALRISRRAPVPAEAKDSFTTQPAERLATPQAIQLNPRAELSVDEGNGADAKTD